MTDLDMAKELAIKVHNAGGTAYFVGGYVRDMIMGTINKDIDIEIYNITPEQLRTILDSLGERTEHGKSFGVFGLKGFDLDISIPRTERSTGDKHTDFDVSLNPFLSTKEGARRRDLTMNAIMYDIVNEKYEDPYNGIQDIKNGIIKHVDAATFIEDPLRVLRVAQFAARFHNMTVAPETIELSKTIDITTLSKERIFTELEKALLKSTHPSIFFNTLMSMGHLGYWFPEILELNNIPQNEKYHQEGNVYKHTMIAIDFMAGTYTNYTKYPMALMLATLTHDLGKMKATENIDGVTHSYKHELYSPDIAEQFLRRITDDNTIIRYVRNMVGLHMEPHQLFAANSRIKKSNKMFDSSMEPMDLIILAYVDSRAAKKNDHSEVTIAEAERYWLLDRYEIFKDTMSKPYVKGSDLIKNGYKPGVYFSEVLEFAHKLRLAGINKQDALPQVLALAKKLQTKEHLEAK